MTVRFVPYLWKNALRKGIKIDELLEIIENMKKHQAKKIIISLAKERLKWVWCWIWLQMPDLLDEKICRKAIEIMENT